MTEDLKNVRLSAHSSEIAERILDSGLFEDKIGVCKFALAYAISKHFSEIEPEKLDSQYDATGSNYNVGSIDDDSFISQLVTSIYPDTNTPYRYARVLMIFGLEKLGELMDAGQLYPLNQWL